MSYPDCSVKMSMGLWQCSSYWVEKSLLVELGFQVQNPGLTRALRSRYLLSQGPHVETEKSFKWKVKELCSVLEEVVFQVGHMKQRHLWKMFMVGA